MSATSNAREARRLTDEALGALRQLAGEAVKTQAALDPLPLLETVKQSVSRWDEPAGFSYAPFKLEAEKWRPEKDDLKNVRILYDHLGHITPEAASDENFWVHLAVTDHADYLSKRWLRNTSHRSQEKRGLNRLLFEPGNLNRSLVRQGLSRLWWYGRATYDRGRENPYELTEVLLQSQDMAETVMGRNFSFNPEVTKGFLEALLASGGGRRPEGYSRGRYRSAAKYLTEVGAVRVLDALDRGDIKELVAGFLGRRP